MVAVGCTISPVTVTTFFMVNIVIERFQRPRIVDPGRRTKAACHDYGQRGNEPTETVLETYWH